MLRTLPIWLTSACCAALFLLSPTAHAQSYEPDQVIVKFETGSALSCRDSSILLIGGTKIDSTRATGAYVVQLPDTSVWAALATLAGRACVEYAEPNYTEGATLFDAPDDSLFFRQWHLSNTGAPYGATPGADIGALKGWAYVYASPDVIVAVMDKGIEITRPDLADNVFTNTTEVPGTIGQDLDNNGYPHDIHGWDFFNNNNTVEDDNNNDPHGTSVASVFGAKGNNEIVMAG